MEMKQKYKNIFKKSIFMKKIEQFPMMYLNTIKKKKYISVKTINKSLTKYYHTKIFILKSIQQKTIIEQELKNRFDFVNGKQQLQSMISVDLLDKIVAQCKQRPQQKQSIIYLSRQYIKGDTFHELLIVYRNESTLIQPQNLRSFMNNVIRLLIQVLGPKNILLTTDNIIIQDLGSSQFEARIFYNISSFAGFQFAFSSQKVPKIDRESYYQICLFLDKRFFTVDVENRFNRRQIKMRALAILSLIFVLGREIIPVIFTNHTIKTLNPKRQKKIEQEVTFKQAQEIHELIKENLYRILSFESTLEKIQRSNIPSLLSFLYNVLIEEKDLDWCFIQKLMNQTIVVKIKKQQEKNNRIPKAGKKMFDNSYAINKKVYLNIKNQSVKNFLIQFRKQKYKSKNITVSQAINQIQRIDDEDRTILQYICNKLKQKVEIKEVDPTVSSIIEKFELLNKKNQRQKSLILSLPFEVRRFYIQIQKQTEQKKIKDSTVITPNAENSITIQNKNMFYQKLSKMVWNNLSPQVKQIFKKSGMEFQDKNKYFLGVALNIDLVEYQNTENWRDVLSLLEYCRCTHQFIYSILSLIFNDQPKEQKIDEKEFEQHITLLVKVGYKMFKKSVPERRKDMVNLHHNFKILNQMSHLPINI